MGLQCRFEQWELLEAGRYLDCCGCPLGHNCWDVREHCTCLAPRRRITCVLPVSMNMLYLACGQLLRKGRSYSQKQSECMSCTRLTHHMSRFVNKPTILFQKK